MWRSILARHGHARRSYNIIVSRIQVTLFNSNSYLLNPPPLSTFHSVFPQSSNLCNNPRFFSHQNTDSIDTLENEDSSVNIGGVLKDDGDVGEEEEVVVEEEEEEVYQIDEGKLENVVNLLQGNVDGSLQSCLDDMGLVLHQDFVIKVIETTQFVNSENLMTFFKWVWNENSSEVTTPVVESFVFAICSSGLRRREIYSLWDLVKEIGEKENGVVNVRILNELIIAFSKLGKGKAALEAFEKFEVFQCVPDADTYYFTIEALCRRSAFAWACSVCQKMIDAQNLPDGEKVGNMLIWLCKGKKAKEAHAVYMAAVEKKKYPTMSSVSFLVSKLSQENETVQLALEMLNDIPQERRKRAIKPFSAVVQALCRIKDVDAAKQLILKMIADGPPPGNAVFNFVITAYSKAGEMGKAVEMMKLLESRGLKPDVYTYAVIASGYSNGGEMEEARKILEEAKTKHVKLTPVLYHTLIRGYCKMDQFDEALKLLTEMKDFGVSATVDEYEKLIQSLCLKALDWETAEKLQEEMKKNGLYLKGITKALIRAVKEMEKDVVEAENVRLMA